MTPAEMKQILDHIDARCAAVETKVHNDIAGTMTRILNDQPEIVGLRAHLKGIALALSGQKKTLPDGTPITSITSAALDAKEHIDKAVAGIHPPALTAANLAAVTAAAKTGAAEGFSTQAAEVTSHITFGGKA